MNTRTPASMCTNVCSTFSSGPYGSTQRANALTASPFMANTSDNANEETTCEKIFYNKTHGAMMLNDVVDANLSIYHD